MLCVEGSAMGGAFDPFFVSELVRGRYDYILIFYLDDSILDPIVQVLRIADTYTFEYLSRLERRFSLLVRQVRQRSCQYPTSAAWETECHSS